MEDTESKFRRRRRPTNHPADTDREGYGEGGRLSYYRRPDTPTTCRENAVADRQYKFSWDFIGDVAAGRPTLGDTTRIEVYRLFQYTLQDVLEEKFGTEVTDRVFFDAGYKAGINFCKQYIGEIADLCAYIEKVKQKFLDMNIGILRIESADMEQCTFVLTVAEDMDCSGLRDGRAVSSYDEGFITGIFSAYSGQMLQVKESDCWYTGDRTSRFHITPMPPA
jgi:predicted hydrocarbon binding protein